MGFFTLKNHFGNAYGENVTVTVFTGNGQLCSTITIPSGQNSCIHTNGRGWLSPYSVYITVDTAQGHCICEKFQVAADRSVILNARGGLVLQKYASDLWMGVDGILYKNTKQKAGDKKEKHGKQKVDDNGEKKGEPTHMSQKETGEN